MTWKKHDYDSIPGTYVFDGKTSMKGYNLNKMCMSFNSAKNRERFADDEAAYCREWDLTEEQTEAIINRDYLKLLHLGANIYYLAKLGTVSGHNMQDTSAQMTGMSVEEFKAKLLAEGENLHG